jgi:hypothetical protein
MRKEHKPHIIVIILMMLVILGVFTFVLLDKQTGTGAGITTSLPAAAYDSNNAQIQQIQSRQSPSASIEIDILIGFCIVLALLFIWYVGIKIAKELRNHKA